jgi:hypothetical protein
MNMGFSYQPGQTDQMPGQHGTGQRGMTPQEAVKILSLRVPRNAQGSPVPLPLLTAAGGGGSDLDQLLRSLTNLMRGGGPGGMSQMGQARPLQAPGVPRWRISQEVPGDDPQFVSGPPQSDVTMRTPVMDFTSPTPNTAPATIATPRSPGSWGPMAQSGPQMYRPSDPLF